MLRRQGVFASILCLRARPAFAAVVIALLWFDHGPVRAQITPQTPNQPAVEISPRINLEVTATDNVFLTPDNREFDLALIASPGINIGIEGRRVQASVDYGLDYLYFVLDGSTDIRPRAFALVDAELIDNRFFVSGRASVQQTFLDRTASLSGSNANISDNRRAVQNYSGEARLLGQFANYADWNVTYNYGLQLSPADDLTDDTLPTTFSDSQNQELSIEVDTGDRFGKFGGRIRATAQRVSRSLTDLDFENDRLTGELSYRLDRTFSVFASTGISRNSLQSTAAGGDGFAWDGGFRWAPSRRTEFEARYGREGPRTTALVQGVFRPGRRLNFTVNYTDQVTANSFLQNTGLTNLQFDDRLGITDLTGIPVDQTNPAFTLSDIDFRRRAADIGIRWQNLRNIIFLTASFEERIFDNETGTSSNWGVSAGYDRRLTPKSDARFSASYRRNLFEGSDRVDNVVIASAEYLYNFSRYFVFRIGYDFSVRQSNDETGDLLENALGLELRGVF